MPPSQPSRAEAVVKNWAFLAAVGEFGQCKERAGRPILQGESALSKGS